MSHHLKPVPMIPILLGETEGEKEGGRGRERKRGWLGVNKGDDMKIVGKTDVSGGQWVG